MTEGEKPIRVGISSCLLGINVRYDGGHRKDAALVSLLQSVFELIPVCPEVGVGMSVPREPVDLIGPVEAPRMIGRETGEDWCGRMNAFARETTDRLLRDGVCGFILKSRSPSCGKGSAKVLSASGKSHVPGSGLFTKALMTYAPDLPVEESETLHDPVAREKFIEAVREFARS
ncbi:MAG: DUF523 domain-containing protein [Verrucomicrobia bacterium]|nr:DUF523 domain-containing protein [Verrucomicrobiota bacterium]